MAEGIGALLVRIGADAGDFFTMVGRVDTQLERLSRKVDKHTKEWLKFGTAAAAAGASVFAFTKNAADTVDQLGKMAQKVGVSVESLSALKHAAALSDVSLDQLGQGLKQLSKFMVENNVTGVSVEEQLLRIAEEFSSTNDGAAKTAAAMKYFGKSGADLIPLLNQGRAGIEELRKEAERLGIVFSAEAAKRAEEFNDNLTRLQSSVKGLQVELAGPLVDALNQVARAMLEARASGESFFGAMIEGFRRLVTGSDVDKFDEQLAKANERLLAAQANVERFNRMGGGSAGQGRIKAFKELREAMTDVARLQAIRPILLGKDPEDVSGMDHPSARDIFKGDPGVPGEDDEARKARERLGQQLQEGMDEELRIRMEADAVVAEMRDAELERERVFQAERLKVIFEAIDEEQEAEIRAGEERLEAERHREQELLRLGYTHRQLNLASAKTFFGHMSVLMNTNSKKLFEIGKAAAIAETVINTHAAAVAAYRSLAGIQVVGPALGAAAAAAAVAFGVAQVSSIRSQSFGGGGGGAVGTFPASPTTGQPAGTPGGDVGAAPRQTTIIKGLNPDDLFTGRQIRKLFEQFNEGERDGGRFVFA